MTTTSTKPGAVALEYIGTAQQAKVTRTAAEADLRALIAERDLQARQIEALQWSERNEIEKAATLRARCERLEAAARNANEMLCSDERPAYACHEAAQILQAALAGEGK